MAGVAMEREGKAAGGMAVQRFLVFHVVECGFWWDFPRICLTWRPSIPPKNTPTEEVYLLYRLPRFHSVWISYLQGFDIFLRENSIVSVVP
jgi:hypothetical protein